jgi:predicted HicB family RNase H-like nuclease
MAKNEDESPEYEARRPRLHSKTFVARIPERLLVQMRKLAANRQVSMSYLFRTAIERELYEESRTR